LKQGLVVDDQLQDVQDVLGHVNPRTTRRYDRSRHNLDRSPNYLLASALTDSGDDGMTAPMDAALLPHLHSARAVEMADAVLGLVCAELEQPPAWISVRTAHDAQTDVTGRDEGRREAAAAHERMSYWASLSSAIACWSVAVATGHAASPGPTS
jgi:hypothetical protein